ncbi:MAG: nitrite/sulfite reductase, partial [Candidatus Omnitrophica bacterium]|nr:nitrite/sulfite reductase [Candidatus Omnitrophota bacterium]
DRYGNRRDRNRARLKFLINEWGIEEFTKRYFEEKSLAKSTRSGVYETFKIEWQEEVAPESVAAFSTTDTGLAGFDKWKKTNVIEQKQNGYNCVYIRCLYGDLTPDQARAVAQIARDFGGGRLRSSITQNMILRWIPTAALPSVFERLSKAGIAERNAETIADITRCPGADTCNLAITHSKGLARDLTEKVFSNGFLDDAEVQNISIKISGCTNSCGQHHIANIGFYGGSRSLDGKQLPHYQMLIGGRTGLTREDVKFGDRIAMIPARRISEAVRHLLNLYKKNKQGDESFIQWSDREGKAYLVSEMKPFSDMEPLKSHGDAMFEDLGDDSGEAFKVAVGKGECAA